MNHLMILATTRMTSCRLEFEHCPGRHFALVIVYRHLPCTKYLQE